MATGKDRQRVLAREHYERQMKKRAERAARARRNTVIGSSVGVVVVIGGVVAAFALIGGQNDSTSAQASPAASDNASEQSAAEPTAYDKNSGTCGYVAAPEGGTSKNVGLPPAKVSAQPKTMTVQTNLGTIEFALAGDKAPCTVGSFEFLASKKYFDNTVCHRLTTQGIKVLQCGDPQASGKGGPTDGQGNPGYRFVDENLQGAEYGRGVLAMANSGPGTNGSQFFIVYGDETKSLPPQYTPFGTVTKGMEIVDKVAKAGVESKTGDGPPKERVELKSVTISGKS
ncbi:peptidyl-prolyl cis-trans isomerase B (cyclophilin B) [Sinosporangium album]|uniref:Peptidyl-prolyl cis-trans isomerase n=1 Tax=Sinosporangium album TaxID=504805 RepID=A0A1G8IW05_9ACTN|nr:peptidylprolyl isomerase [Sinosporangium album]SDI23174.1 peptidyl-prolyl cis-trans isomerase B (cyclophilin B) [Sinosporangium album]